MKVPKLAVQSVVKTLPRLKVLLLPILVCSTLLVAAFYPVDTGTEYPIVTSVSASRASSQALAVYLYTPKATDTASETEPALETVGEWYVTTDEYSDRVGNLCSLYNFFHQEWGNVRQWCVDNYVDGWPYGPVKDEYPATTFGVAVSMASAACCIRESSTVADNMQNMGTSSAFKGAIGTERSMDEAFHILKHPARAQGYGLIQFTFSNLQDLVKFCEASNLDPRLMENQLKFMAYQYYSLSYMHSQYEYLEAHNDDDPTLNNVISLAYMHTSVIGMGNVPSRLYSAPNNAVRDILLNWGKSKYPDFVAASGSAYDLLHTYATTGTIPGR